MHSVKVIKIGQGSSIAVDFAMAPKEKWVKDAEISRSPAPATNPAQKSAQATGGAFGDF